MIVLLGKGKFILVDMPKEQDGNHCKREGSAWVMFGFLCWILSTFLPDEIQGSLAVEGILFGWENCGHFSF